jgi:hypothetical protein
MGNNSPAALPEGGLGITRIKAAIFNPAPPKQYKIDKSP